MADSLGEVVLGIKVDQAGAQQALQQFGQTAQQETTKVANSIDALRQKLKDQQAQLAGLEIGSGAFAKLRQEIAQTEAALKSAARSPLEAQQAAAREQATLAKQAARAAVEAEKQATQQRIEQIRRLNEAAKTAAKQRADAEAAAAAQQQAFIGAIRGQIGGLVRGLGVIALGEFFRQGAQEAIQLESVTRRLSITLGEQGAAQALAFTKGLADELGLSFKTLTSTFSSFTAAATAANVPLDQQQALFTEVAKSATNFGLTSDQLEGALLALQQIASKGTVSMEELRGQLGERLPVAFAAAAKGLGVTQQELIKLVESGKLTSKEFFPAFTAGLKQINGGPSSAPTAAQAIGKLTNAFTELKTELGQGILPLVKPVVAGLAELASLAIRSREARQALGQAQATNLGGFGGLGPTQLKALEALIKGLGGAKLATDSLTAAGKTLKPVLDSLFGKKTKPVELIAKPQTGGADPVKPVIVSIDSLNERLKALRAEQNKVGIGTLRFQELGREIPIVEKALQAATDAAKGTSAAVAEIRPDTFNVDTQSAALKLNQARLDLTGQIAQAETDLANAKLRTEEALLNAQEKRALEGVTNDRTRAAIQEQFQLKRDELERRSFDLKARAQQAEFEAQLKQLDLEGRITDLAAQRGEIAARAQLAQAQAKGAPAEIQAAEQALRLAQQERALVREINAEKITGATQLFELRRQQLEQERRAAAADDLPLPQVQQQPGFRAFLDSIQIDPAPIQENSKASLTAAENISNSNTALVDRISALEGSIGELANKDWSVQVNVTNEAGGAATVNTVNSLQ
jgi:tape measure domain-containing protein